MFNGIENYLKRFANMRPPDEALKAALQRSVSEVVGISIAPTNIDIRGDIAFMTVYPPAAKSEIMLHKQDILRSVERQLGSRRIRDLR